MKVMRSSPLVGTERISGSADRGDRVDAAGAARFRFAGADVTRVHVTIFGVSDVTAIRLSPESPLSPASAHRREACRLELSSFVPHGDAGAARGFSSHGAIARFFTVFARHHAISVGIQLGLAAK
jgi:hypothetical protein